MASHVSRLLLFVCLCALSTNGKAPEPQLSLDSLNPLVLETEYAVRGELLTRAAELETQLQAGTPPLPFAKTVRCNIGNPQALGQKPLSFPRQVLSLVMNPPVLSVMEASKVYPADVFARARKYIASVPSAGAYSESQGVTEVRKEVASFIEHRDQVRAASADVVDVDNIFLTDGASAAVKLAMQLMIRGKDDAILVPVPQYPIYSAVSTLYNGSMASYFLSEENSWSATIAELRRALREARDAGKNVRGLVIINPGNPTGQSMPAEDVKSLVRFCVSERLVLMADEVYQENIYGPAPPFFSARRAAIETGEKVQLMSFHSISKGFSGECGLRGGYLELYGISADVRAQLVKLASLTLCSNVPGQFATGLMVNPPSKGEASYPLYVEEKDAILSSLERRAGIIQKALNDLPGVTCNKAEGAMYLFPQLHLPEAAVAAANKAGKTPDTYYCLKLLEATGLVVVPGSGFGQKNGTYHFRTTFLPPEKDLDGVIILLGDFHRKFMEQYGGLSSKKVEL